MNNLFDFFKGKKKNSFTDVIIKRLEQEIEAVAESKEGIYIKSKHHERDYYIDLIIDRRFLGVDFPESKNKIPDYLVFLLIIDTSYPQKPPVLLSKTTFSFPSVMDGRDLMEEVMPEWTEYKRIIDIAQALPTFIGKVINTKGFKSCGTFHLGAIYNIRNFDNMEVNKFDCKVKSYTSDQPKNSYCLNLTSQFYLILSGDKLLLFEKKEDFGTLLFWASLFSITEIQINKKEKQVDFIFYDNENNSEFQLSLEINNILFFRDTFTMKMGKLAVKGETKKIMKGQVIEKRLSNKEINVLKIDEIVKHIDGLKKQIDEGVIDPYTINTFTTLCGKAIDHYSKMEEEEKYMTYLILMQNVLQKEEIANLIYADQTKIDSESTFDC